MLSELACAGSILNSQGVSVCECVEGEGVACVYEFMDTLLPSKLSRGVGGGGV